MALSWNVEKIKDYETVCWIGEKGSDERRMNPVTHALIFNAMAIDIGTITDDNAAEVYARTRILEGVNGALLIKDGKPSMITMEDIEAHIGLWCNVSFQPRAKWAMRWFVGHGDYLVKYGEKRKSEQEIYDAEDRLEGFDVSLTETLASQFRADRRKKLEKIVTES